MKRIFALFLVVGMCMSIVSCGNNTNEEDIHNALKATNCWVLNTNSASIHYMFSDGMFIRFQDLFGDVIMYGGSYEIKDDVIHFIPDDGTEIPDLYYTYDKELRTLSLMYGEYNPYFLERCTYTITSLQDAHLIYGVTLDKMVELAKKAEQKTE